MTTTQPEPKASQPMLTTTPRSPRPKPFAFATGDKKQKKPQQVPMQQSLCKNQ